MGQSEEHGGLERDNSHGREASESRREIPTKDIRSELEVVAIRGKLVNRRLHNTPAEPDPSAQIDPSLRGIRDIHPLLNNACSSVSFLQRIHGHKQTASISFSRQFQVRPHAVAPTPIAASKKNSLQKRAHRLSHRRQARQIQLHPQCVLPRLPPQLINRSFAFLDVPSCDIYFRILLQ